MKITIHRNQAGVRTVRWSLMAAASLTVASTASALPAVQIVDLTDGAPVVTTDLLNAVVTTSPETATINGFLVPATSPSPLRPESTSWSVILLEQNGDISDFLTLTSGKILDRPVIGLSEDVSVLFMSDGAAGFDAAVAALPANTPRVLENGDLQDLTGLLGSGLSIQIQAQSDVTEGVPDSGGAFTLLGFGLLSLALTRRLTVRGVPQA